MDRRSLAERYEFVSIDNLLLSVRTENALLNANIDTIGRLIRHTEKELIVIAGIEGFAIDQLKAALANRNLCLTAWKRKPTNKPVKTLPPPEPPVVSPPPPSPPPITRHEPRTVPPRPAVVPAKPASATPLTISMITREAVRVLENNLTFTEQVHRRHHRPWFAAEHNGSIGDWVFTGSGWQQMSASEVEDHLARRAEYNTFHAYPKMMFHLIEGWTIVKDKAEQDALGPDWSETPFDAVS